MADAEVRGRLLKHFYGLRDVNGGWVPTSEIILSPDRVSRQAIANVCQHLAEAGYIRWEPFNPPIEQHAIGRAKITGSGIDVVTGTRVPTIDIRLPDMGQRDAPETLVVKNPETRAYSVLSPASSPLAPAPTASEILGGQLFLAPRAPAFESSLPTSSLAEVKKTELLTLKPTLWGIGIDLKEAGRRLWAWRKGQK